ncbi:MAG: PEGA domain-containing protein [Myxococcales bacterium]|nr:PEGA domain-containing protein [Myxococcales bacterium]
MQTPSRRVALAIAFAALFVAQNASAQEATLEVFSYTDGATVSVDGEPVSTTPMLEPVIVEPGTHTVRVSLPGFVTYEEVVEFGNFDDVLLEVDLLPFGGIVRVVTPEPGATVFVDDNFVGLTPFEGEVRIGEHRFRVSRDQHEDWFATETIAAGEEYLLEALLVPLPEETQIIITESTPFYREWWFWSGAAVLIGGGIAAGILLSEDEEARPVDVLISLP